MNLPSKRSKQVAKCPPFPARFAGMPVDLARAEMARERETAARLAAMPARPPRRARSPRGVPRGGADPVAYDYAADSVEGW